MNISALGIILTGPQAAMLACLRDTCAKTPGGKASPRQLAKTRWPHSTAWERVTHRGATAAGGALGGTMPMKAAAVLWRLHDKGLAERTGHDYDSFANAWEITELGQRWLGEASL